MASKQLNSGSDNKEKSSIRERCAQKILSEELGSELHFVLCCLVQVAGLEAASETRTN